MEQERAAAEEPPGLDVAELNDADLFGLRLAGQVLGHKAALAGRPHVARWFSDLEAVMGAELARRGVGVVLVTEPGLALAPDADASDYALLSEYLAMLAANPGLSDAQRLLCRRLMDGVVN
jgi:hypothetical protein